MPLIPLICPNCGGNLTVDSDKDAAICEFCGKPYIVKDAIVKNYINNVTNINAENVNIYAQKDFVIKGGVLMEYNGEAVDVVIPDTVKKISSDAFKGTAIESVTMPDSVIGFVSFDEHGNSCPPKNVFMNCDKLVHVKLSQNIEELGLGTFEGCSSLKEVEIPIRVKELHGTFSNCSSLQRIILPEGLKIIGSKGLLKVFGSGVFSGCSSLQELILPSTVTAIGGCTFTGCSSLQKINIPSGITAIDGFVFGNCSSLREINLPSTVTTIGDSAFKGCSSLQKINIPSGVRRIGDSAFEGCSSLQKINIPSGVRVIGYSAFKDCKSLQQADLPDSITEIYKLTFWGCSSLQQINIPSGVRRIGDSAFKGCSSLREINLPSTVTTIGDSAFKGCSTLQQINIPSDVREIGNIVFDDCKSLSIITGAIRFNLSDFYGSKYCEIEYEKRTKEERRSKGKCQHCGGDFSGLFRKVCTKCGKEKDY